MTANIMVSPPYQPFTLPNKFSAVFNGEVWCGLVDKDPLIPLNQVQVYVVNEDGSRTPVQQPIKTNHGGFLVYNGKPSKFVTDSNHSMLVRDSLKALVWYEPNMSNIDPETMISIIKPQLSELYKRMYLQAGYNVVDGSFAIGGTLASDIDVLFYESDGKSYGWTGSYPPGGVVVAPGSTPDSSPNFKVMYPGSNVYVHHFGDINSPDTWISALDHCAKSGVVLHVQGDVSLSDIAKYVMPSGTKIVIDWTECGKFNVLDSGDWEKLVITSEKYAEKDDCYVEFIGNIKIVGTGNAFWGGDNVGMRKNIPIRIQANTVKINGYDVRSVWGFGLRIFNPVNVEIGMFNAEDVGGHSTTYNPDDFGDGIYFGGMTGDVNIHININRITGMLGPSQSTVSKGLSRIGIAFENTNSVGQGDVKLTLVGGFVSNYERVIHAEGIGDLDIISWDSPRIKNAAVLLHRYNPPGAESKVTYANINEAEYTQKEDLSFGGDFGIGGGCYANLNGGTFYGLGVPFNITSDVRLVPSGANWTFNNCTLKMNNSRLQFRYGKCSVNSCRIIDHGSQTQNADGSSVRFSWVSFDISDPSLNGSEISPAGKDSFINCSLSNQTFKRTNYFDSCLYLDDLGNGQSNGIRVTSYSQEIPKIPLAIYTITEMDTAVQYINTVYDNGGVIGGKLVSNPNGTFSIHNSVKLHAIVSINWFK